MTSPVRRVLVVGPVQATGLDGAAVEREEDFSRALDLLLARRHDVGVIGGDLGGGRTGTELIREAMARDCPVPLILVGDSHGPSTPQAAVDAGAVGYVDGPRAGAGDLAGAVTFAHANRLGAQARNARFLKEVSSFLSHDGKNAIAGIGGAIQIIHDQQPADSLGRAICQQIQERLAAFGGTLEAVTLILRASDEPVHLRVPLRDLLKGASLKPPQGANTPPGLAATPRDGVQPLSRGKSPPKP